VQRQRGRRKHDGQLDGSGGMRLMTGSLLIEALLLTLEATLSHQLSELRVLYRNLTSSSFLRGDGYRRETQSHSRVLRQRCPTKVFFLLTFSCS